MAEPIRTITPDRSREHPERHESAAVNVRPLAIAVGIIIAIAVAVHVGMYYLHTVYSRAQASEPVNRPVTAVRAEPAAPAPGIPRLQAVPGFHAPTPREDLARLRAENARILGGYGPGVAPGTVRIPIGRAMDLALERGLFPARTPPAGRDRAEGRENEGSRQ